MIFVSAGAKEMKKYKVDEISLDDCGDAQCNVFFFIYVLKPFPLSADFLLDFIAVATVESPILERQRGSVLFDLRRLLVVIERQNGLKFSHSLKKIVRIMETFEL